MKIVIEGHNYQVSDAAKEYATEAVEKLEKFFSPIIETHVILKEEKGAFKADLVVRVSGQTLKSSDQNAKLFKAIDDAADKMVRQLQKLHDKRREHRPTVPSDNPEAGV